jgi:hypothetical protein
MNLRRSGSAAVAGLRGGVEPNLRRSGSAAVAGLRGGVEPNLRRSGSAAVAGLFCSRSEALARVCGVAQ